MVIDSHAHVILPTEKQILMMAEAGIEKTILFATSPHPEKTTDLAAFEMEFQRLNKILAGSNQTSERITQMASTIEELSDVIKKNPAKFLGFGSVPAPLSYEETAKWVVDTVLANKLRGLGEIIPKPGAIDLLEPIFAVASNYGALPIWVHTFHPCGWEDIVVLFQMARRYPTIPLILGHMGGIYWLETIKMAKEIPNVYLDLSATYTIWASKFAIQELPERTLFSSDAPHGDPVLMREMVERVCEDRYIKDLVLGGTIERILGLS